MSTLYDMMPGGNFVRIGVKQNLVGSKTAYIVGGEVIMSPAMFFLYVDNDQTQTQRDNLLKSINCETALSYEHVSCLSKQLKKGANSETVCVHD